MNWENFWKNYRPVKIKTDSDLLYQVGKTIAGGSINSDQLDEIANSIIALLDLKDSDILLDLCCGNGVLTYKLSKRVKKVIAIDFSEQMIINARKYKNTSNIGYYIEDIKKIKIGSEYLDGQNINKVLLYDGLAYFTSDELKDLLKKLNDDMSAKDVKILLGSVLDKNKKWMFYNTFMRKLNYLLMHKLLGMNKGLGKWWSENEIRNICDDIKIRSTFFQQNTIFYTSHYRMDVVIER